ncbi:signal transduction histidine kinase [Sediminihabitans luteus]|uniref:histidine kinase n=1 Tax=Sediminihabitans luteus TaxID=1138585 RepID=A0A2M9CEU0_9CELL|nr:histidine kinase [Sediminihabitans luteus]PJJ70413.1 signal transduction histidine kinase [Sediminihabitans luteus]GII97886.1 hypothetical protein Slu03_02640 [Sediminihabitans luteus]
MTTTIAPTAPPAPDTRTSLATPAWVLALIGPRWAVSVIFAFALLVLLAITPVGLPQIEVTDYTGTVFTMSGVGGWLGDFASHSPWRFDSWVAPLSWFGSLSSVVAVLLARRRPLVAALLASWPFVMIPLVGTFVWGWWLGLLMVTVLASLEGVRRALVPLAATVAVTVAYAFSGVEASTPIGMVSASDGTFDYAVKTTSFYLIAVVAVVTTSAAIGAGARSRRRTAEATATARRAFEVESLATERARLAHDLHDVVAHHVSLVAVRAESAPFVHPDLDEDARAVLALIATDARSALDELRQVLAVLQRTEKDGARAPQPGACEIVALVDQARSAGQQVELEGACDDVPSAQGYVLYRAAQEALTNARRHAPGAVAHVRLSRDDDHVGLEVVNASRTTGEPTPGRGLLGMRERVEALGGTVEASTLDGCFVVRVALPCPPADGAGSVASSATDTDPGQDATGRTSDA